MATLLSPGVYVTETDASTIVPTVSNNVAFFAGDFNKGPVEQPYVITTKQELEYVFGTPDDVNFNQWFQCYKFLDYANQLIITRGYEFFDTSAQLAANENYTRLTKLYAQAELDPLDGSNETVLIATEDYYDFKYSVNDWISLGIDQSDISNTFMYKIDKIESIDPANPGSAPWGSTKKLTQITLKANQDASADVLTTSAGSDVFIHSNRQLNGATEAFVRGDFDESTNTPVNAAAVSSQNIDYNPQIQGFTPDVGGKRTEYFYDIIKNKEDFDYQIAKGATNPLASFLQGDTDQSKLKFYTKTASTEKIEIAIANPEDFIFNQGVNFAIAFSETVNSNTKNTYLTNIFSYYPQKDQVGIAIKKGDILETFLVSFDEFSTDGNNRSNYIENVINEQSKLVYVIDNKSVKDTPASYLVADRYGWAEDSTGLIQVGTPAPGGTATTNLIVQGGRNPKISYQALNDAYFSVEDKERYEIDVVIGNEYIKGDYDNQNAAIDLAETRKDCVAFVGARYVDAVEKKSGEATQNIINYITAVNPSERGLSVKPLRSMFASLFANYFKIYDKYNKKSRFINCAGDAAGIRCQTTTAYDAWWVSAGIRRGVILGVDRLAFTPSQPQRDDLYKNGINPIVSFPGSGNLLWGNKTLYAIDSSFNRINIRTLFNTLERAMAKAARSQVFEFNDPFTRNSILSMFNPYLATIKAGRGIVDYLVVVDESNNTPDVISRNELKVDIYIKPNYAAEFIQLNFTNVGTRSFSEVIGA